MANSQNSISAVTVALVLIFDTPELLAEAAAERFVNLAQESITQRGRFSVALAVGNTPGSKQ
jgi:6-phosphogluconolactonase/glucosamine-6-phosphate isomerase/deaminase